jgi:hypothetical protein
MKTYSNPCIRCGTERVVVKTWEEQVGASVIINKETACPNPECQKQVDIENKKLHDKSMAMRLRSEQRMIHRRAAKDAEKSAARA